MYLKGLRGLSNDRAHCSGGPCQRPSSAPPLQPSPSTRPLFRLCTEDRSAIESLVAAHGLAGFQRASPLRRNALACVALPTCALAMAEAERYLPDMVGLLEARLAVHGLEKDNIHLRITGCPNGCARPYLAEIALVGKAPGRYNLFLAEPWAISGPGR